MSIEEKIKAKLFTKNKFGYEHQVKSPKLNEDEIQYLVDTYNITTYHKFKGDMEKTAVHAQCISCQARHMMRYYGTVKPSGEIVTTFDVRCDFIKGEKVGATTLANKLIEENKNFTFDEAIRFIRMSDGDPVSWLEVMLGYDDKTKDSADGERFLRWYQKEQIRCTADRLAIREGRRTGKTFAICNKLIEVLFTDEKRKGIDPSTGKLLLSGLDIVIITPFQNQLTLIFDELQNLIERNTDLREQVRPGSGGALFTKTPNYCLYTKDSEGVRDGRAFTKTGGSITGFVAGATNKKDGTGGGTIRGTSADLLYIDEMDMITAETLQSAIKPILLTSPNVKMIVSSTPIGKRAQFYDYCLRDATWKADYLPSTVLPHWEKEEQSAIADSTEDAFEAEYMAHFPDGAFGVFKPTAVYAALDSYEYADVGVTYNRWWEDRNMFKTEMFICLGIDWNKNAGTEYYVVGYHPPTHRWWALDAVNIPQSKFSGPRFSEELKALNHKWQPNWIYADNGYGHHILDNLELEAHQLSSKTNRTPEEDSTVLLKDRLKRIEFGGKIHLRDPVTNTDMEKHAKEYLVENAKRHFEDMDEAGHTLFRFPSTDKTLLKQLLNYKVAKFSATGKPVYGMDDTRLGDHRLDAMMLALAGLQIEAWHYSKNVVNTSGNPGLVTNEELKSRQFDSDPVGNVFLNIPNNPFGLGIRELVETTFYRDGDPDVHKRVSRQIQAEKDVLNFNAKQEKGRRIGVVEESALYYNMFANRPDQSNHWNESWAEGQLEHLQNNYEKLKAQTLQQVKKFSRRIFK